MIVFCEECGQRYVIDPEKMKSDRAVIRCKVCDEKIVVERPKEPSPSSDEDEGQQGQ